MRATDIEKHRDGLVPASLGIELPPMTEAEFEAMASALLNPESEAARRNVEETVALAEGWAFSAPAYAALVTAGNTRLHQVLAGRAYARLNLKATEIGLAIQPMSQSLQEFPEMAPHHRRIHEEVEAPAGHTLQMLPRLGHAEPVPPTPRRDPHALVAALSKINADSGYANIVKALLERPLAKMIAMYNQLMNDINLHIIVVWESSSPCPISRRARGDSEGCELCQRLAASMNKMATVQVTESWTSDIRILMLHAISPRRTGLQANLS